MSTFTDFSKEIARDFLHSVIFADDGIKLTASTPSDRIVKPTRESVAQVDQKTELKFADSTLDIIPLIEEFLKQGIPCSFYTLKEFSDPKIYIKNFVKADALILDWQIKHDDGDFILDILEGILDKERNTLKVILIYTSSSGLLGIIEKVKTRFNKFPFEFDSEDKCSVKYGSIKISVYSKPSISINKELRHRVKEEHSLIESLLDDFTSITAGLVSNVALKAITVLRNNSSKLLFEYSPKLDSSFLLQRAFSPNPEDVEALIQQMLLDSINSIFDSNNISEIANYSVIDQFLDFNSEITKEHKIVINSKNLKIEFEIKIEDYKRLFSLGYKNFFIDKIGVIENTDDIYNKFENNKFKETILESIIRKDDADEEFALLIQHKSNFYKEGYIPKLTLGAIISTEKDTSKQYLLCIQQRCDSVRIELGESRTFIFLPLTKFEKGSNQKGGKPSIIIKSDDGFELFIVGNNNCQNIITKRFDANRNGCVKAENGQFIDIEGAIYKWILDLKDSHAQKIVNDYAAKLSRVGIDESEWLRRYTK